MSFRQALEQLKARRRQARNEFISTFQELSVLQSRVGDDVEIAALFSRWHLEGALMDKFDAVEEHYDAVDAEERKTEMCVCGHVRPEHAGDQTPLGNLERCFSCGCREYEEHD